MLKPWHPCAGRRSRPLGLPSVRASTRGRAVFPASPLNYSSEAELTSRENGYA